MFYATTCSVHRLEAVAGGYCSRHYHEARFNRFYVEAGILAVEIWRPDREVVRVHPGETLDVEPWAVHRFNVLESGVAWEIYWPEPGTMVRIDDIVRLEQGGFGPIANLPCLQRELAAAA